MSEQIVQVQDAATPTKNMRTIQQTAGGNTVQSEVVILATGASNGGDTDDARQVRTLTAADVVTVIQKLLGENDRPDVTVDHSGTLKTRNAGVLQAAKGGWGPACGNFQGQS